MQIINYVGLISCGITAITAVVAFIQYRANIRNGKVRKAIELSEYYKDNIISKQVSIAYFYKKAGIETVFNSVKWKFENFDITELKQILPEEKVNELKNLFKSAKTLQVIQDIYTIDGKTNNITDPIFIKNVFSNNYIYTTLNNLEYFSMFFTHKLADESVVFQSLHQTYLQFVEQLYYYIADFNQENVSQYFTNIIELYGIWKKRATKTESKKTKNRRNSIKKGKSAFR